MDKERMMSLIREELFRYIIDRPWHGDQFDAAADLHAKLYDECVAELFPGLVVAGVPPMSYEPCCAAHSPSGE